MMDNAGKPDAQEAQVVKTTFGPRLLRQVAPADAQGAPDTPQDADGWLAAGHALSKKTLYREAIAAYSQGLSQNPFHALLLRFRGHRHLSVRSFQQGAADLELSSRLDPDNWDTWYHLGLARYLLGEYQKAEQAYETCLSMTGKTQDPTLMPAIQSWLWRTKVKLGKKEEADMLLQGADPGFDAGENQFYQNCVLACAGLLPLEQLMTEKDGSESSPISIATQGYGLSMYYESVGDAKRAEENNRKILEKGFWPGFGYIAAEADLQRKEAES